MLRRTHDWPGKLAAYIEAHARTPFQWGTFDCALFACNCIQEMTGVDLAPDFRDKYNSLASAQVAIHDYAGGGLAELIEKKTAENGMPGIKLGLASRGDVVLVKQDIGDALGIIGLDGREAICAGENGLRRVPRNLWLKAWKV